MNEAAAEVAAEAVAVVAPTKHWFLRGLLTSRWVQIITKPINVAIDVLLKEPIKKFIHLTPWVERIAQEHPAAMALAILAIIYLVTILAIHVVHTSFLKIFGPTRYHLAATAARENRREVSASAADEAKRLEAAAKELKRAAKAASAEKKD